MLNPPLTAPHLSNRFICLDTNNPATFQAQRDWLEPKLAGAGTKKVFVWFHHPPFSSGSHGDDANVKAVFVPLFQEYGAEMVFAGHDHIYERAMNDQTNIVRYIVTGGAGAPLSEIDLNHNYDPALREAWYARGTEEEPGDEDAFHLCVLGVTPSAFALNVYKWDGTPKDQWP